jgi:asparagine synthase (glutamine-hydrolysing)
LLARHHGQEIRTFTIGFSADSHDESPWAKKVAEHCGTRHTEYLLDVNEGLSIARDWGSLFDEPFGDPSGIPTLLVSRLAREEVKVVLSADGGDELFSGYDVYDSVLTRMQSLDRMPRWACSAIAGATSGILPAARGRLSPRRYRQLHHLWQMMDSPTAGRVMDIRLTHWLREDVDRLIGRQEPPRPGADDYPGRRDQQMSLWDIHHYLPEDILAKVDRTTMNVSIEGREPLLDHRLMEFALALPAHLRRGALGPKHLLKRILHRYVPRELVDRPKQGFGIPLENWLRRDLKQLVEEYLAEDRIRRAGLFDVATVRETVDDFYAGRAARSTPLWFLLCFEMWREQWG